MGRKEKIEMERWKYNMSISYINDAEQIIERARRAEGNTKVFRDLTEALFCLSVARKFLRED